MFGTLHKSRLWKTMLVRVAYCPNLVKDLVTLEKLEKSKVFTQISKIVHSVLATYVLRYTTEESPTYKNCQGPKINSGSKILLSEVIYSYHPKHSKMAFLNEII